MEDARFDHVHVLLIAAGSHIKPDGSDQLCPDNGDGLSVTLGVLKVAVRSDLTMTDGVVTHASAGTDIHTVDYLAPGDPPAAMHVIFDPHGHFIRSQASPP